MQTAKIGLCPSSLKPFSRFLPLLPRSSSSRPLGIPLRETDGFSPHYFDDNTPTKHINKVITRDNEFGVFQGTYHNMLCTYASLSRHLDRRAKTILQEASQKRSTNETHKESVMSPLPPHKHHTAHAMAFKVDIQTACPKDLWQHLYHLHSKLLAEKSSHLNHILLPTDGETLIGVNKAPKQQHGLPLSRIVKNALLSSGIFS